MTAVVIVGVQWGDEGKGKVVDYLSERAEIVVRFQGGHNAGHTVVVGGKKTALSLLPSGILREKTRCLLASGVVLDPGVLFAEMERLGAAGVNVTPKRLGIAAEAQLILPYHSVLDVERERALSDAKIGTTGKGIGPAYEDAASRIGIRVADLYVPARLKTMLERNVAMKNAMFAHVWKCEQKFCAKDLFEKLSAFAERLKPFVTDVSSEVTQAIKQKKFVMFEGAQGTMLDANHGTYPFVTSSNTIAAQACVSAGVGPQVVDSVLGICKAYCTRVGGGPFPTEETGEIGDYIRKVGAEFGTVTGRPRRCGWFDAVLARRAGQLNGVDAVFITKLDVLSGLKTIRVGTEYQGTNSVVLSELESVSVEYKDFPGWDEDITGVRSFKDLPQTAQNYLSELEKIIDCPIAGFSVGPDREQTIIMREQFKSLLAAE